MGRALYREHRPLSLSDVKGQSHITDTLEHAIQKGAISHAYLFTGPRGVGKTSVARILAHRINNLEYSENETHLDIIEIDAASNRRIDEIRDLRDKVHIAPTSAKYKVYIIDEVHMLTREAFNALLKTLEEPPEHAVFILATTEAHKVPDTIISRSQQFSFKPVTITEAVAHLREIADKESMAIDDAALELLAHHGNGSFRDSISMLDQLTGFDLKIITAPDVARLLGVPNSETLEQILDALTSSNVSKLFDTVQVLRETGTNPSKIAQSLLSLLRMRLSEKNQSLPYNWAVQLMKDLLPLTSGNATFETLEVALLGAIIIHDQIISEVASKKVEKVVKSRAKIIDTTPVVAKQTHEPVKKMTDVITEKNSEDTVPKQKTPEIILSPSVQDDIKQSHVESPDAMWTSVLNQVKSGHNTLYGVLRMAQVHTDDSTITLTFRFDFHKKQFTQGKNMKTLHEIVATVYGRPHAITMNVSKTTKPPAKILPEASLDMPLSNISNIFGGAELLD
jgi:DNA polymerase-3 subunit gamma/tau